MAPQLHFYVSDSIAAALRAKAKAKKLPLSRYLARLVQKEVKSGWPEGYFDEVLGHWPGELHREEQPPYDVRENPFD